MLSDKNFSLDETNLSRQTISENIKSFQLIIYKYLYEQNNKNKTVKDVMLYSLKDSTTTSLLKENTKIDFDILLGALKFIVSEINSDEPFKSEIYDDTDCQKCPYFYLCRQ